jgi:nicotinate-nucleotide adenylyltransferase
VLRRVGILGGTFDPPHIGHLAAAVHVRDELALDEVLLVVANDPWQKSGVRPITGAAHRLAMVDEAVQGLDRLAVSDIEIARGGPSYSVDTVEALLDDGVEPVLVVGADAAAGLDSWHRAERLRSIVEVAVLTRPGDHRTPPAGWRVRPVTMPTLDVASSELRTRVARGRSLDVLVPPAVVAYILRHGLYSP